MIRILYIPLSPEMISLGWGAFAVIEHAMRNAEVREMEYVHHDYYWRLVRAGFRVLS